MLKSLPRASPICQRCCHLLNSATRNASTKAGHIEPARTRFAPSPTGNLHLGSLRTALFNYLWAKRTGGQFVLRIEDTDVKRTIPGAEEKILADLRWAGLQWDEGPEVGGPYGPYRQSERTQGIVDGSENIYKQHAQKLIGAKYAYRCFCSPQELAERAQERWSHGLRTEYDSKCSHVSAEQSEDWAQSRPYVIRMRTDEPTLRWDDLVFGHQGEETFVRTESGMRMAYVRNDYVLLKRDGWPTYHLASVVDDYYMKITHVIRGVEWLKSTPKHVALYNALGWETPKFAHVGLLRDPMMNKLSKRDLRYDLEDIKKTVLPEALMNYLVLLGWKQDPAKFGRSEVYTISELVESFDLQFNRTNPIVSLEKLQFLQEKHFKKRCRWDQAFYNDQLSIFETAARQNYSKANFESVGVLTDDDLKERVKAFFPLDKALRPEAWAVKHRYAFSNEAIEPQMPVQNPKTIKDVKALTNTAEFDEEAVRQFVVSSFEKKFGAGQDWSQSALREWNSNTIDGILQKCIDEEGEGTSIQRGTVHGAFHAYLRQWVAWGQDGQGMADVILALGYDLSRNRMKTGHVILGKENDQVYRLKPAMAQKDRTIHLNLDK